jgi:hypothetical protein
LEISDSEKDKELVDSLLEMATDKLKECEQQTGKLRSELLIKQKALKEAKDRVSRNLTEKGSLDYQIRKCQAELKGIQLRQHSISNSGSMAGGGAGMTGASQSVPGGLFKQTTRYTIIQPDRGEPWNLPIEPMHVRKSAPSTVDHIKKHTGSVVPSKDPKDKGLCRWSCCGRAENSVGCADDTSVAAKGELVSFPSDSYKPYSNHLKSMELRENVLAAHHDSIVLPVALNKGYVGGPVIGLRPRKSASGSRSTAAGGAGGGSGSMEMSQSLDTGSMFSSGIGGHGHAHGHSVTSGIGHGHAHGHNQSQSKSTYDPHCYLSHHSHTHAHTHLYQELPGHLATTFAREATETAFVNSSSNLRARPASAVTCGLARTSAKARALGTEPLHASIERNSSSPMRTSELFVQQAMFNNKIDPRRALDGASQFLLARKSMDSVSRPRVSASGKSLRPPAHERYMMRDDDEDFGHRISMVTQPNVSYKTVEMYDKSINTSSVASSGARAARPSTAGVTRLSATQSNSSSAAGGGMAGGRATANPAARPSTATATRKPSSASATGATGSGRSRPGSAAPGRPLTASGSVGLLRECTDQSASIARKQGRPLTAHTGPHLYTSTTITPGACLTHINARIV